MLKNIFSFFKQKKIISFVLLFFVGIGIILPITASAAWWEYLIPVWNQGKLVRDVLWTSSDNILQQGVQSILNAIIYATAIILISVFGGLFGLASMLLNWVISPSFMPISYTGFDNPVISAGWTSMRDLANMFIVLGFVVIGVATTLRFKDYEAKKLLPKLIIVALLINFSLLICGIFIDGSNIATKWALQGQGSGITSGFSKVLKDNQNILENALTTKPPFEFLAMITSLILIYIISFFIYILFTFLFLFRYVMLWILVMLSPIAFVCYAFPFTKKYFEMWWSNFFGWCIIGITGSFFIYLSDKVAGDLITSDPPILQSPGDTFGLYVYLIPLFLLMAGFLVSLQTSAIGASIITGTVKKYGAKGAKAAGMAGLKGLANVTGASRAGTAAKDWATQHLENAGIMRPGATAAAQRSRLDEKKRQERVESMTTDQMVNELTTPRRGLEGSLERAKIMERMAKENTINRIPDAIRQDRINEAIQHSGKAKELIKGMGSGDIARIVNNPAANPLYDEQARTEGVKALIERNDLDQIIATERPRVVGEAVRNGVKISDLAKSDYQYKVYDTGAGGRAAPAGSNPNAIGPNAALFEQLETSIPGMTGQQRRNIDQTHLTARPDIIIARMNEESLKDYRTSSDAYRVAVFGTGGVLNANIQTTLNDAYTAAGRGTPNANIRAINRLQAMEAEMLRLAQP